MEEKTNKLGTIFAIIFISFIIFGIFWLGYEFYKGAFYYNKDCMIKYAKSYCESQNLTFYDYLDLNGNYIRCENDHYNSREVYSNKLLVFSFLDSEKLNCKYYIFHK